MAQQYVPTLDPEMGSCAQYARESGTFANPTHCYVDYATYSEVQYRHSIVRRERSSRNL